MNNPKVGAYMKKGDIVIIAVLLAAAVFLAVFFLAGRDTGNKVLISVNNEQVFEGSLKTDREIDLDTNLVVIKNGKVYVDNADCHNQICVRHRPISKKGETIVCLPNKILIEIK